MKIYKMSKEYIHVFKFMQKRFTGVCENMSEAGKLVSCQVLQR